MITFGKGSLFYRDSPLGFGDLYVEDIPMSKYAEQTINCVLDIYRPAEISCEIKAADLNLFNEMLNTAPLSNKFTLIYQKPIMIQARWHKKYRIRKKWLKRYGMKPDTVEVLCNAETCDYDYYENTFDIDTNSFKYNWKPHQKRRELKIEQSESIEVFEI